MRGVKKPINISVTVNNIGELIDFLSQFDRKTPFNKTTNGYYCVTKPARVTLSFSNYTQLTDTVPEKKTGKYVVAPKGRTISSISMFTSLIQD